MKFLSYRAGGVARFGLAGADGAIDLTARTGAGSLKALIALGGLKNAARWADAPADHAWAAVEFLPVIPDPGKIFCIGVNYEEHRTETGRPKVSAPTVFTRFADTQIGHGAAIPKPAHSDHVDFEGELAVIIGEGGRDIPEARALDHVAGFSCYNDVSIRDFQYLTSQFTPGKNFVGTGPFGPFLVTPDEVGPLGPQRITTRLNGETVQDSTLGHMIFPTPELIAFISKWSPLAAGDVIVTGTPGGVGARRTPPLWMKPGDEIVVEIERVGRLCNTVA